MVWVKTKPREITLNFLKVWLNKITMTKIETKQYNGINCLTNVWQFTRLNLIVCRILLSVPAFIQTMKYNPNLVIQIHVLVFILSIKCFRRFNRLRRLNRLSINTANDRIILIFCQVKAPSIIVSCHKHYTCGSITNCDKFKT